MSPTTQAPPLMTADEFLRLHGDETGIELIDGEIVRLPMPGARHGLICGTAFAVLREFVKPRKLGRLMTNDTFIRTVRKPDGCRGADVIFLSYETLPADQPIPVGALIPPVELVVEVRSPHDTFASLYRKAGEYLEAGVRVVVVLDPDTESAAVFRGDDWPQRFHNGDEFTLPDILPGFAVPVKAFFE
ncbi:MAG: Uma2 family endonuclease [Fimbriiglobus sp.]